MGVQLSSDYITNIVHSFGGYKVGRMGLFDSFLLKRAKDDMAAPCSLGMMLMFIQRSLEIYLAGRSLRSAVQQGIYFGPNSTFTVFKKLSGNPA